MSNILIADANGRRRIQIEALAQANGHHTYSVGTLAEAMRYAEIYVPEVLIAAESLPDANLDAIISALRSSERQFVRNLPIVTSGKAQYADQNVTVARNNTAAALVVEAESVLSKSGVVA